MMSPNQWQLKRLEQAMGRPGIAAQVAALRSQRKAEDAGVKSGAAKGSAVSADIIHLLNRITYGPTQAELQLAQAMGYEDYLELQLQPESLDDAFLESLLADLFPSLAMSYQQIFEQLESNEDFEPAGELIVATIARQLFSPRQLFELMTEFWTNHFNVYIFDGPVQFLKTVDDRENIRPFAMGNFGDLLRADARSPAMLYYLDNFSNTKFGPQENYARELMELHTLGVDGGYTESDVVEVARCFTGWTIDPRQAELFTFEAEEHDTDEKQVLGQLIPAGGGIEDGEQVLELLLDHPSTGTFLAGKLCRRFIADHPPQSVVNELASIYTSSGGDIRAMLRGLFLSDEFRGSAQQKFRRPIEYVNNVVRTLDPVESDGYFQVVFRQLESLGQIPYFSVPPTGYGDESKDWLNTNALLGRWNVGFSIAFGDLPAGSRAGNDGGFRDERVMADFFALRIFDLIGEARTPAEIVDTLLDRVLHRSVGADDRSTLIAHAAAGGPASAPLTLVDAVARGRAVLSSILASRYFQNR